MQWAHAHQRCVLTARFPKGKKELEVSLFQVNKKRKIEKVCEKRYCAIDKKKYRGGERVKEKNRRIKRK